MHVGDTLSAYADSAVTEDAIAPSHISTPPTDTEEEGLSTEQLNQIWEWNTPVPPTINTCMHDLVREQALKEPTRPAIHSWDGDFTYGEVDTLSDSFAAHLASLGLGRGAIVPLCFEKSRWTAIAVLAVMKAGATFALMDPSQPEGRLRTIVEQTGASAIVTSKLQEDLGTRIAPNGTRITLCQENLDNTFNTSAELQPVPPDTDLYIQFTSGSTGKPKGVVITHANYSSGAVPRAELVGYQAHSRVLDFASYAFDVCIDCMLCTLSAGGCLCIPSDADRVNDLSGAIRAMRVNMAHMTPSVARVLDPDIIPALEVLGLGGEAISAGDAAAWGKSTKVVNAYGPSECTVGCAVNPDVGAESAAKPHVTIGRGVGGTTWIVDAADHDRLVPIGAVGELLVEGPIVGPGYLGDPEKTAAAFINDPKWLRLGSARHKGRSGRLYKTGDLVKYDATDGTIVFVGRGDQQVKLRGQRIELAEIEYNMRDKLPPGTRVAVEVIKPGGGGSTAEPSLVAFVSDKAGLVADSEGGLLGTAHSPQVRDALATMNELLSEHLPIYMIPAAYIPLQVMPLLVSAKTDRKRLRELGSSLSRKDIASFAAMTVPRRAPSTPMERQMAQLWGRVVGADAQEEVGANDNFFNLGGDSLRAMRLVALARAEGIALTVADIFSNPVLSDMAVVARPGSSRDNPEIPPFSLLGSQWSEDAARAECAALCEIEPSTIEDVYPCTPLQEGLMALSAKVSEAYVAQRVVELADETAARDLLRAFETAAADCAILRTRIVQVPEHGLMQVVVKDSFEQKWVTGQSLNDYLVEDRNTAVALGRPLVRYGVVCGAGQKTHFVLTMHHALYDGWCMPLVVERVNRAYNGLATQRPAQFKHFIHYLGATDRRASEAYWRERLAGAAADSEQFPPLPWPGYQQQADSLLEHYVHTGGKPAAATMATVIRGAWALLVAAYTGSRDVVFGETLTGRNAPIPGVEDIEGPMIATVPVRVAVDPDATVAEYLQRIHDQSVAGIAHEHFGLQHIRRLSPDAREACDLRTGLVMHPSAEEGEGEVANSDQPQPANSFVPAGDAEAAQEALKFNTYALMLVCSLDPRGYLIMASFDSRTVAGPQMERMLAQLGRLTQQFIENPDARCGDLSLLVAKKDVPELARRARDSAASLEGQWRPSSSTAGAGAGAVTEAWVVDPEDPEKLLPAGAVGELLVSFAGSDDPKGLEVVEGLQWAAKYRQGGGKLYRTGKLAKYNMADGTVQIVERKRRTAAVDAAAARKKQKQKHVSATSAKQKQLRHTWSRILGLDEDEIGLSDSFFQLGGDSIGAMKIVSELRAKGLELTVPEIFQHRTLYEMASVVREKKARKNKKAGSSSEEEEEEQQVDTTPFSLLGVDDVEAFVAEHVRPVLAQKDAKILDILPARPLQHIAVRGTTQLPRYSSRYELFHFDGAVDRARLFASCEALVARNEILRTVFVEVGGRCFGVVLESLDVAIDRYEIDGDMDSFVHKLCDVDVQTRMPLGSAFVKFMYVEEGPGGEGDDKKKSCLALRISHAQYDEICLTSLLRQFSALYNGLDDNDDDDAMPAAVPFSAFVYHVARRANPASVPYWRDLLAGSRGLTVLRPNIPLASRVPDAITRTVDISARLRDVTVATLPTAAWALYLARRLATRDVLFGEVVSGRNFDLAGGAGGADAVMGPTWQYVPVRVRFGDGWTGADLLDHVQRQHVASAQHEGMALCEIVEQCTDWPAPRRVDDYWFDSVVHQDVYHVEEMAFGFGGRGGGGDKDKDKGEAAKCRLETVYPHYEPLREWKVQAFVNGDSLTLEIVTFKDWMGVAAELLNDLEDVVKMLVNRPGDLIF
ncbi:peptide synthetase [Biscogniauxia mediterranea]|nr:peptide synthetase [Biscogniauxia mediterranea]